MQTVYSETEVIGSSFACTGSQFSVLSSQWAHYNSFQRWLSAPIRIFSVLTEVSGRDEHADISFISPKITGVVPVSGASTTHPVGLYGRCGETGERKVVLCWG